MVYKWKHLSKGQQYFAIFLLIIFFRAIFSLTVGLIDDEAYHWSWAQDVMLSYYDHPGMIAWLNWLSTYLFGDTLGGVRLPSFICYTATVFFSFKLAEELFDRKAAAFTALMLLFTPFWGFGGYVASPEPLFMLSWILAAYIFWQGVRPDKYRWSLKKTWIWLGIIMGLGLNSKFIIALLAPGFGLYLLATKERRKDLLNGWPWFGFLIATFICLPIFLWNLEYDWPGFRYQFHDRHQGDDFSVQRWLVWFGAQWGLVTPVLYPLILLAFGVAVKRFKEIPWRFILCLSLPSILIFYPQPLFADYKPHWSGAAYVFLIMGAGALWSQGFQWGKTWLIKPLSRRLVTVFLVFLVPVNILLYAPFAYPFLPKIYRIFNPEGAWNPRWDLSNEFHGWEELGRFMNRRQREIHAETSRRPFLAALRYETTAQAWWGTKQKIYSLNTYRSHYTVVHKHNGEWDQLSGLDALVVTTEKYHADPNGWAKFDSCTPEEFKTYREGEISRIFTLWYCKNFQGVKG